VGLNQLRLTPLRLTVNFRSSRPLLTWANLTFASVLPKRDDPERGAVGFTASEPQANAALHGGVFVHPVLGDRSLAREAEAKQIGGLIAKTLAEKSETRIAVLVSNRRHLRAVVSELHARAIPFNAVDIDPLTERPPIQDLVALTRAVVHLADRTAWLAVLRAPWCGLLLADLHALCGDESIDATIWQLLNDPARIQRVSADGRDRIRRIVSTLQRAVATRGRMSLRECIERTWHALGGPGTVASRSDLQDCAAYFARLAEIERNGDVEDVARLEGALSDLYANADVDSANARVELMTIHRAKGLEFDVVILPALDGGGGKDHAPLLRTQELPQVERALLLAPIFARGETADPIYAWLEQLDKARAKLEKGRLLYVAATRAVHELHLFGAVEPNGKPRANTFLQLLWPIVEPTFATQSAELASSLDNAQLREPGIRTRRLPLTWKSPEPVAQSGQTNLRDVADDEPLHPEFEWVGETARHVGTVVHREIERVARNGIAASAIANPEANRERYRIELAELGVPPHLRDAALGRVVDALTRMLSDERGRWLLAGEGIHRDAASELALSGVVGGAIVNGVIDRTFIDREGTRWIVDFKTSAHEGGAADAFLASEVERYRNQLRRYATLMRGLHPDEPIKAALYFPLLGAWREVAFD
jgi:ATP-dependent exoDNAse (exonuclease V) beta subunit